MSDREVDGCLVVIIAFALMVAAAIFVSNGITPAVLWLLQEHGKPGQVATGLLLFFAALVLFRIADRMDSKREKKEPDR